MLMTRDVLTKCEADEIAHVVWWCRGDVVEIDSWVAGSGKNGMRRDWLVRKCSSGEIVARSTR
jgi:fatty acyl-ACP thioesterase B